MQRQDRYPKVTASNYTRYAACRPPGRRKMQNKGQAVFLVAEIGTVIELFVILC